MNKQRFILFSLVSIAVLQIMYYYPLLPSTVASHFDVAGNPNGCSSKKQFIGIYMVVILMMSFSYLVLPLLLKYIPVSLINLPKRDYWLAPERKQTTFLFIGETMLSLGNATTLFLIITFQLAFEANLSSTCHFSSETMFILLGGYLLFISVWLVRFIMRFRRTDTNETKN
jgi:uncharacterized membrane protein